MQQIETVEGDLHYDAVIVGGGMIGAALALGLAQEGWRIAVLEPDSPKPFLKDSPPDLRISALTHGSITLLQRLGVWNSVLGMRATPYRTLETWEWPESKVTFTAAALGLTELGYMVENSVLHSAFWQQLSAFPHTVKRYPVAFEQMYQHDDGLWQLTFSDGRQFTSPLVIGADGAESRVRAALAIGITGWEYRQSCLLMTAKMPESHHLSETTWQQFTPNGPRAFLPLTNGWGCLVWYDDPRTIQRLSALPMSYLSQEVANFFPSCVGEVEIIAAGSFPLVRRHASCYVKPGAVLIGDAAHTINPLAGQGANLGYRDVEALLIVLTEAHHNGQNYAAEEVLLRYQRRRKPDNLLMQTAMDLFYKTFSNDIAPAQVVRNVALGVVQRSGRLKEWALRYALGG